MSIYSVRVLVEEIIELESERDFRESEIYDEDVGVCDDTYARYAMLPFEIEEKKKKLKNMVKNI